MANHFLQKGGDLAFNAFCQIKSTYPESTFHIVGGDPGREVRETSGVVYHGVLKKECPVELQKLIQLYSEAFLLLHPTREDTNPLVITEAGYFGCPTLSVDRFAIPELIRNGETGVLMSQPLSAKGMETVIINLLEDTTTYLTMRRNVWGFSRRFFSWEHIGQRLQEFIDS